MHNHTALWMTLVIAMKISAQTVNLSGVVSDDVGQPIAGAVVNLVQQEMDDTTGDDGRYSFVQTHTEKSPVLLKSAQKITIDNGVLTFSLNSASAVKVELFDTKGKLLGRELSKNAAPGTCNLDIEKQSRASGFLIIKAVVDKQEMSFPYMAINGGRQVLYSSARSVSSSIGKRGQMDDVVDTLLVAASGYREKAVPITSYENQQQNITLELDDGKNAPGPSAGCGKTLGDINQSGTYTITSSGMNRTYIIDIPPDYDKNKPYRLIFGMHCMGGSAEKVDGTRYPNDQTAYYYHLKPLAQRDNVPVIFVAPQGNDNGTWNGETDHQFFADMLSLFKDNLCIDTTRVFSCGFSFGAMFTYSLSTAFQNELRAVACYAPANYNIWLPQDKKLPIAYYQATGTEDGICPWVNSDPQRRGGKYCLLNHVEANGCNSNVDIPLATSGTHVVTEFQGCQEGYPVKFSSFQGGHQCNATDPGTNFDWIPEETWEFFMRF